MRFPINMQTGKWLDQAGAAEYARVHGVTARPSPPRNPQAQSGARKILVTFDAPIISSGIIGYKIYTENENSLLATISDPNVRQYNVEASSGSAPPTKNIFISSFTKSSESTKLQIQGKAIAEAGAPSDPTVPPSSAASGTTGGSLGIDGTGADSGTFHK
ncbi:MAG TPA: hypothetical protein VM577_05080 [Anaerovoracaceae bacterium]|nr:hypothetical protein [Anaerovoracaceae bacterium]